MHIKTSARRLLPLLGLLPATAAWSAPDRRPVLLRYRVSAGQVFVHDVSLRIRIRADAPEGLAPFKAAQNNMDQAMTGRLMTAAIRQRPDGVHEALQSASLRITVRGRTVELPADSPLPYLITPRELRSAATAPSASGGLSSLRMLGDRASLMQALPDKPLRPGDTWQQVLHGGVPGGPPLAIKTVSRYLGQQVVDGDPCARVETRASLPRVSMKEPGALGSASVTVRAIQLCSLETGLPRRVTGTVSAVFTLPMPGGKQPAVGAKIAFRMRQVEPTQHELALARQWSAGAGARMASRGSGAEAAKVPLNKGKLSAALASALPPAGAGRAGQSGPEGRKPERPVEIIEPKAGTLRAGKCTMRVVVPEESDASFVILRVDGAPAASMNSRPFRYEVPRDRLTPGEHTLTAEVYAGSRIPTARTSVRVRVK